MRMQACAMRRNSKRSDNAMLGKGRAVQCRAVIQEGKAMKKNITNGQSGDCLVYLGQLIYIWTYGFAHGPWFVHCTSLIIDGIITYCPIG